MDSRTSSILINLDKDISSKLVSNIYSSSKENIEEIEKGDKLKVYSSLRQTVKECYFVGSLKYGNNFVM